MELFDSHCHLDSKAFDDDRELMLDRARVAGVSRFVTIGAGDGLGSAERAVKLAADNADIWAAVGVHPHDSDAEIDSAQLETLARAPRVVAIGETGLDFHYSFAGRENQDRMFRLQVRLAREVKKPIVIHCRNAAAEVHAVLVEENAREVGGVFHCFSEGAEFAKKLIDLNFIVSFPGIVTFRKSEAMREVAKSVPLDHVMLETDAPYLAPEPYRGKRCESAFMVETAKVLARIHGISLEDVALITTANALKFFAIS